MCVATDSGGAYLLDLAAAIGELLPKIRLLSASISRAPIGRDCYNMPSDASVLPRVTSKNGEPRISTSQSLVGSLMWESRCTRPDISFAVHKAK